MPSKALRPLSSTCLFHCASVRPARAGVCVSRSPLCPVTTTCPGRSQRGERPPCPLARADLASVSHGLLTYGKPACPCGDLHSKAHPDEKYLPTSTGCQRLKVAICTDVSTSPLNPSDPPPSQPGPRPSLDAPGSLHWAKCSGDSVRSLRSSQSPSHTPVRL